VKVRLQPHSLCISAIDPIFCGRKNEGRVCARRSGAHWVLWNIPATTNGLPEGVTQGIAICLTEAIRSAPQDPCTAVREPPPNGPLHNYVFGLYCPGHQVGRETIRRRFRDARQRDESDSGSTIWRKRSMGACSDTAAPAHFVVIWIATKSRSAIVSQGDWSEVLTLTYPAILGNFREVHRSGPDLKALRF